MDIGCSLSTHSSTSESRLCVSVGRRGGRTPLGSVVLTSPARQQWELQLTAVPPRDSPRACWQNGWLPHTHHPPERGVNSITHTAHVYDIFLHYLQALWINRDYYELIENHVGCLQYCFRSGQSALVNNHQFFRVTKSEGLSADQGHGLHKVWVTGRLWTRLCLLPCPVSTLLRSWFCI